MKNRNVVLIVSFVVLIAVSCAVSFFTLYSQSIRLDESQSIWASTKSVEQVLLYTAQDVHVPLYPLLLHFWMQLFGTTIIVVRLLSFLFFLLTLPVLYRFAKESSMPSVALLTVALFTLSPFVVWYSNEARMYTLFTFVTSLNHLYFLRMVRSDGKASKFGYFLSTILGVYTHYFFFFMLFTQGLFALGRALSRAYSDERFGKMPFVRLVWQYKRFPLIWLSVVLSSLVFFVPYFGYVLYLGSASNTQPLIPRPTSFNLFQTFVQFLFGFQNQAIQTFIIALWPLSLFMLFLLFTKRKRLSVQSIGYFGFVTIIPIALVFLVSFIRPIFLSRYLIMVTPTLFFIIAWTLLSYSRKVSTILVISFMALLSGLAFVQNISASTPVKEDYVSVAEYLSQNATPKDIVVVSAPFTVYPIEYSYEGSARISTIPDWDRYVTGAIPAFDEKKMVTQIDGYKKQYKKIYMVLSYDQGYEDKIRQYMDTHYEMYRLKKFSPGLELRVYVLRYDI
jgi:uncharacterized membrane protein